MVEEIFFLGRRMHRALLHWATAEFLRTLALGLVQRGVHLFLYEAVYIMVVVVMVQWLLL